VWSFDRNFETEHADQERIEAKRSSLNQNSAPAATLSEKLEPNAAKISSELQTRRKKSPVSLADIGAILEILQS
jgi:hypothetical protein